MVETEDLGINMINRQAVLEYLNKHPSHTTWQMRLHFLQANREIDSQSSASISSIANQLNYILRDLESIGTIAPSPESLSQCQEGYRSEYSNSQYPRLEN
jgi:hypothetical protein